MTKLIKINGVSVHSPGNRLPRNELVLFLVAPAAAVGGIRRTGNFGTNAAYIGARDERDSEVSLVLVTFLSTGTTCHVNLPAAALRRAVSLLRPRPADGREAARAAETRTDGWTDSWTSARCVKEKYNRRPDAAKLPH